MYIQLKAETWSLVHNFINIYMHVCTMYRALCTKLHIHIHVVRIPDVPSPLSHWVGPPAARRPASDSLSCHGPTRRVHGRCLPGPAAAPPWLALALLRWHRHWWRAPAVHGGPGARPGWHFTGTLSESLASGCAKFGEQPERPTFNSTRKSSGILTTWYPDIYRHMTVYAGIWRYMTGTY